MQALHGCSCTAYNQPSIRMTTPSQLGKQWSPGGTDAPPPRHTRQQAAASTPTPSISSRNSLSAM